MVERKILSTYEKALALNLDPSKYGVFAEIGAGQETANWFFRVSASAGTVAKTISAYDMKMSDALYGKASRYVSQSRSACDARLRVWSTGGALGAVAWR